MDPKSFWSRLTGYLGGATPGRSRGDATTVLVATPPADAPCRTFRVGVASTVGNVREHNEDNFFIPPTPGTPGQVGGEGYREAASDYRVEGGSVGPFLVADGMGGQLAGEKASQMAVDLIPKEIARRLGSADPDDKATQKAVREAIAAANQEILGLSHVHSEFSNMGTTVVMALFRDGQAYIAGIGDSRVYRVRHGRIEQMTKDHSLADALVEAGTISADELPNHKFKHILYLYLGSKDARGGPDEVRVGELAPGDRFVLASDGLTGVVDDETLARVVAETAEPLAAASRLVALALENQSKDNVTCMVIHAI